MLNCLKFSEICLNFLTFFQIFSNFIKLPKNFYNIFFNVLYILRIFLIFWILTNFLKFNYILNLKNSREHLNFSSNFVINFSKFYKKFLTSIFLLNVSSNRNFGDAIAVQDFSGIHVWNFVRCSPNQNKSFAPLILILLLQFLTMKLSTFWHSVLLVD